MRKPNKIKTKAHLCHRCYRHHFWFESNDACVKGDDGKAA
jgi:hypothetical protein